VWLSHIPKTESSSRDGTDRAANRDQTDEEPNPSDAAPVKGEKNRAWSHDERHDERDRDGKVTGATFHWRNVKCGREGRAQSQAEN
jgi:hypothetical protein